MQQARLAGRLQQELKMLQDPSPGVCVWPSDELNLSQLEARMYTLSLSLSLSLSTRLVLALSFWYKKIYAQ